MVTPTSPLIQIRAQNLRRPSLPGIQPADVEELVARGATTVVLSQGMNTQLRVHPDTRRYLDERSITVHVAETREAAKIYIDLTEGTLVAGLLHATC